MAYFLIKKKTGHHYRKISSLFWMISFFQPKNKKFKFTITTES